MTFQLSQTDPLLASVRDVAQRNAAFFDRVTRRARPAWLSPLAEAGDDNSHAATVAASVARTAAFFARPAVA